MIKYILILLIGLSAVGSADAQTWNEWFKQKKTQRKYLVRQIAALKAYLQVAKKGYEIAQHGLKVVGDIKDGSFRMDGDYFASLKAVNPAIQQLPKAKLILQYHERINSDLRKLQGWAEDDPYLTDEERVQLASVKTNVLQENSDSLDELSKVMTSGTTEMKDDERLNRIDKIYSDTQRRFGFVQKVKGQAKSVSLARAKEEHDLSVLAATYQLI